MTCEVVLDAACLSVEFEGVLTPEDLVHYADWLISLKSGGAQFRLLNFLGVTSHKLTSTHVALMRDLEYVVSLSLGDIKTANVCADPALMHLINELNANVRSFEIFKDPDLAKKWLRTGDRH